MNPYSICAAELNLKRGMPGVQLRSVKYLVTMLAANSRLNAAGLNFRRMARKSCREGAFSGKSTLSATPGSKQLKQISALMVSEMPFGSSPARQASQSLTAGEAQFKND